MRRRLALGVGAVWIMVASCSGSSGTACGQVEPCGGDVVGSWSIVGSCLSPAGMFSTDRDALFGQFCTGGTNSSVDVKGDNSTVSWVGAWSFNATMTYAVSILASVHETFSCDDGETCTALDTAIKAAEGTYSTIQSAGCTAGGGSGVCNCTIEWASFNDDAGTYADNGTALSLAATSGLPTAQIGYCVQGNTMHWIPTESAASGPPFPDIVAERQ
jgi:hypothetical protein